MNIDKLNAADITFLVGIAIRSRQAPICLHGIGGDATSFMPQIRGLAKSRRVLSWNMPGYGASAPLADMDFPASATGYALALMRWESSGRCSLASRSAG